MNPVRSDIDALVAQMRALAAQAAGSPTVGAEASGGAPSASFGNLLKTSIDEVNNLQQQATGLAAGFEAGDPRVSLAQVMVSSQKARVAFQAITEVRNRLVKAYQDVMNMPV